MIIVFLQVSLWWHDAASEVARRVLETVIPQDAVVEIQEELGLHSLSNDQNWSLQVGESAASSMSPQSFFRSCQHGWSHLDHGSYTIQLIVMCQSFKH